jgi:hypothetical protein
MKNKKYRTTIELITDASDEHEAVDIAGEYLRGGLESGVMIKCKTKSIRSIMLIRAFASFGLVFSIGSIALLGNSKNEAPTLTSTRNVSAIQAPLKTSQDELFRENWEDKENREVIEYIKK